MATRAYPTLVVPLELLAQQAIQQLNQLAAAGQSTSSGFKNLTNVMKAATGQLQQTGQQAGQISSGIGGFFIMSRALRMSNQMLKGGTEASMDYELALTNLGIKLRSTADDNETLGRMAQQIAMKIGPLDVVDVVRNMGQMTNLMGSTVNRVGAMADPFSSFVSNIVELSEHAFQPEAVGQYTAQILNLFGGIEDVNKAMTVLEALHGAIAGRASRSLPQLVQSLRPIVVPMEKMGMSVQDIISLGVWGTVLPQTARSGRDIRQFFTESANVGNLLHKKGAVSKDRLAALQALGIADAGQPVLFDPKTGKADWSRLAKSMSGALGGIQAREGTRYNQVVTELFGRAFSSSLARGFGQLFGADGIRGLSEIGNVIKGADSIQGTLNTLQQTSKVSLDRLVTDVSTIASAIFRTPSRMVGFASNMGANALEGLYKDVISHPGLGPAMSGMLGLGALGTSSLITGMMFKGAAGMGIGGGLSGAAGAGLGAIGTAAMWGSVISAVVVGGMLAYQHSAEVRVLTSQAQELAKKVYSEIVEGIFGFNFDDIKADVVDAWKAVKSGVSGPDGFFTPYHMGMYNKRLPEQLGMSNVPAAGTSDPGPYVAPAMSTGSAEPPAARPVVQQERSRARGSGEHVQRFKDMHDMMEGIFDRMNSMTQPYTPVGRAR